MKKVIVFLRKIFSLRVAQQATGRTQYVVRNKTWSMEPAGAWKSKPSKESKDGDLLFRVEEFLNREYEFRFNGLTEVTEYRRKGKGAFSLLGQRELNGLCLDLRKHGIECWDRDVSRYVHSVEILSYHPMREYMDTLPAWDGIDRVTELAQRVSSGLVWIKGFHRWMLGLAAQWMGVESLHANSVAPVLISQRQGMHKSTFCKLLVPSVLQSYYTDSFDLASVSAAEQKLALFGLINLDELDKYSPKKMALLKNLIQMAGLNIRKSHKKNFSALPRIASFIGTSNQRELLTDPTGSRRFLCQEVTNKIDCSLIDHEQLYAQLKAELKTGKRHWFSTEEEREVMEQNAPFCKRGVEEDVFFHCFRKPDENEKGQLLSAAYLFEKLKKTYPSTMRDVNIISFRRTLTSLGIKRVHTRHGNLYDVISL